MLRNLPQPAQVALPTFPSMPAPQGGNVVSKILNKAASQAAEIDQCVAGVNLLWPRWDGGMTACAGI